jgi:hypothetical protein
VYTQENRGIGYRKYVLHVAQAPFMVGMHWFMWMDYGKQAEATTGSLPDENVGFVSGDETVVYEELGRWARRTNAAVEVIHRAARWAPHPEPAPERRALRPFAPTVDGDLSEWPQTLTIRPTLDSSLLDGVQVDHTYFLSWDTQ